MLQHSPHECCKHIRHSQLRLPEIITLICASSLLNQCNIPFLDQKIIVSRRKRYHYPLLE